ncbi:MAG: histidine phosphatase family protein [Candidatus Krumholzibacteriia bacterium]
MSHRLRIHFLRHGLADRSEYEGDDDDLRPLTDRGRERMAQEAAAMAELDLRLDVVITSPLLRARQTAEIVAGHLGLDDRLHVDRGLGPEFSVPELARLLARHPDCERFLLVGHEPGFSEVIGEITGGSRVVVKKGGLARVDLEDRGEPSGELVWLLPPGLLAG